MNNIDSSIIAPITSVTTAGSSVAVIRISGHDAIKLCNKIFPTKNLEKQKSHTIHFGKIVYDNNVLDEVLISIFKAPRSYTGENVAEISCHASPFIVQKILNVFIALGARAAVAGEFTKRAFFNNKIDLLQAESISSIISAKNKYEHQAALKVLQGHLSNKIKKLREDLITAKSLIELEIDFVEDHNLDIDNINNTKLLINKVKDDIIELIKGFESRPMGKTQIVIIGEPNVGKSSLFNVLINEDRAIVANVPGTTRDIVSETLIINGTEVVVNDTAGLRNSNDVIESIGINKTYSKIEQADIILYVFDITNITISKLKEKIQPLDKYKLIPIASKSDIINEEEYLHFKQNFPELIFASTIDNNGIDCIKNKISTLVQKDYQNTNEAIINVRHHDILTKAINNLKIALDRLNNTSVDYEIIAFELNDAILQLKYITGDIVTDDYLDNIFSNFCIGK